MPNLSSPSQINIPRRRWRIAFLLGIGVLVNYFDRVNLSVAHAALITTFAISNVQFGYLSAAYNWTYTLCQLPVGVVLDKFGVRRVGRVSTFIWSVASFAAAITPNLGGFFAARLLLGIGEAPTFPANAKAIGYWFPAKERTSATSIFDGSAKFASAIGVPLIGMLLLKAGWRWSFAATGLISFLYFLLFCRVYRDPWRTRNSRRRNGTTSWRRMLRNRFYRVETASLGYSHTAAQSHRRYPGVRGLQLRFLPAPHLAAQLPVVRPAHRSAALVSLHRCAVVDWHRERVVDWGMAGGPSAGAGMECEQCAAHGADRRHVHGAWHCWRSLLSDGYQRFDMDQHFAGRTLGCIRCGLVGAVADWPARERGHTGWYSEFFQPDIRDCGAYRDWLPGHRAALLRLGVWCSRDLLVDRHFCLHLFAGPH